MNYKSDFLKNLNECIAARGVSGKDIARGTGLSEAAISNYRTGKKEPQMTSLCLLADYLEISLDELVGRKEY